MGVAELMPYSNGLSRNIAQCLNDFDIPLYLSHTVKQVCGKDHVEKVIIAKVDEKFNYVPDSEMIFDVDTLILSVGLVPYNIILEDIGTQMSSTRGAYVDENYQTSVEGIFACGNALHVHDLVDYVSEESGRAGRSAARYVKSKKSEEGPVITIKNGNGVRYTVPSFVRVNELEEDLVIRFRSGNVYRDSYINVLFDGESKLHRRKPIITPGEMEQVILKKEDLASVPSEILIEITEI